MSIHYDKIFWQKKGEKEKKTSCNIHKHVPTLYDI